MSYHNIQIPAQSNTNAQGEAAPVGYHYMPDGTLMSDAKHGKLYGGKIIKSFDLDLSDIKQAGETRSFSVNGSDGAAFSLEIKNDTGQYYNFVTNLFQTIKTRLENKTIRKGSYLRDIVFPSDSDGNQYDIYLFAEPGTKHANYNEIRFGDGSIDINSSTGSGSLLLRKVIYQYEDLTLTLNPYSVGGAIEVGTIVNDTVTVSRGFGTTKASFTISFAVINNTKAYQIIKQPAASDILSFIEPVVGAVPVTLPGENIYPSVSDTDTTNTVMSSTDLVTMATNVEDKMSVGDKVTGTGISSSDVVTVLNITDGTAKQFRASQNVSISDGVTLSFSNQMNYSWPISNYVDKLKEGMIVLAGGNIATDTAVGKYQDTITIFPDTEDEEIIIKNERPALDTLSKKPTIVKGLVTVQEGNIIFNKQQVLANGGTTLKIGGYGENEINRVYGYDVKLTNLEIALTAITTTTTAAVDNSVTVPVASVLGILPTVSVVSGIGINPALANPTVSARSTTSGAGNLTLSAAQTLESGVTFTFAGAGQTATITGNIEIIKAGTANKTLRFDVDKLLSIT